MYWLRYQRKSPSPHEQHEISHPIPDTCKCNHRDKAWVCIVYCVLCIVYRVLCIVYCALCIVHCALCIVYCVLCFVFCVLCICVFVSTNVKTALALKSRIMYSYQRWCTDLDFKKHTLIFIFLGTGCVGRNSVLACLPACLPACLLACLP